MPLFFSLCTASEYSINLGMETRPPFLPTAIISDASWASACNYLDALTNMPSSWWSIIMTILLRVKNSTAFATDDEFDRNKRWIARSWCGGGAGMRRRLSSNGVRRLDCRSPCPPRSWLPPFVVKSTAWASHNQLPDRHIARDPRLRLFCVESVPSLIDTW